MGKSKKRRLEVDFSEHLNLVQTTDLDAAAARTHAAALSSLAKELGLDETFKTSLPKTVKTARSARTAFDNMVLHMLEQSLTERIAKLAVNIEVELPGANARAESVSTALREAEAAAAVVSSKVARLSEATDSQNECSATLEASREEKMKCEVEIDRCLEAQQTAQSAVDEFKAWPMECFTLLKAPVASAPAVEEIVAAVADISTAEQMDSTEHEQANAMELAEPTQVQQLPVIEGKMIAPDVSDEPMMVASAGA